MMNTAMWLLACGALGVAGYAYLSAHEDRGLAVSVIIGVAGGFFGWSVLAPMLGTVTGTTDGFSLLSLLVALTSAAGCLAAANLLSDRYGV